MCNAMLVRTQKIIATIFTNLFGQVHLADFEICSGV